MTNSNRASEQANLMRHVSSCQDNCTTPRLAPLPSFKHTLTRGLGSVRLSASSLTHFFTAFFVSSRPRWISTYCKHAGVTYDCTLFGQWLFTTFPFLACRSPFLILIFAWISKWHLQLTSSGKSKYLPVLTAINALGCCSALEWLQLLFKGTVGLLGLQHLSSPLYILKVFIYTKHVTFPRKEKLC